MEKQEEEEEEAVAVAVAVADREGRAKGGKAVARRIAREDSRGRSLMRKSYTTTLWRFTIGGVTYRTGSARRSA